jgi:hypothetical protein
MLFSWGNYDAQWATGVHSGSMTKYGTIIKMAKVHQQTLVVG